MDGRRDLSIHFMDGSTLQVNFPKQAGNPSTSLIKLNEALAARQLLVEADGALLLIPFENIKYVQCYPAPDGLPAYTIKAASIGD
jgi:hypothetical protein